MYIRVLLIEDLLVVCLKGDENTFYNKGTNGRWRDVFLDDALATYEKTKSQVLSLECVRRLEQGHSTYYLPS